MSDRATHPVAPISDDLLGQEAIKASVSEAYRAVIGTRTTVAERLYDARELAMLPRGAIEQALGVGNPVRAAALRPGEIVIDLGCGGGIDTILAAHAVAPAGKTIGLDMLPEMLDIASRNAAEAGVRNVEWLRGEIEAIPLPDASVDAVISNGVVNLSPRKSRAFAEIFRVLRSGGRMVIADIVVDEDLPPEILTNAAAWAG
jgi:SAM-dependent methyltransferase